MDACGRLPVPPLSFSRRYDNVRRSLSFLLFLVFSVTAAFTQAKSLAITTNKTVVDGVVNPSEYSFSQNFGDLSLYVNRTADALYFGVVGNTTGWVSVGLGSLKMDGATMFMGFVGADGKVQFKPQAGSGHSHKDAGADVAGTIISSAIKESGGTTTMEIALKPAAYIKSGQSDIQIIYAAGTEKSFIPRHMLRGALALPLAK
jgi:hypothetical protein